MTRRRHTGAAVLALLLLAGCVPAPPPPPLEPQREPEVSAPRAERVVVLPAPPAPAPIPVPVPDEASRALSYFERARRMPSSELARELDVVRAAYGRSQEDGDRLRLAMLLALPGTGATDEIRALELLDPFLKTPAHALYPVAAVLSTYLLEQRRLAQHAQSLQKEVNTLQQKLDALRSLERALSEREGAVPRRR
jgi:outer membrane murein-binding lipoprotein Lpp